MNGPFSRVGIGLNRLTLSTQPGYLRVCAVSPIGLRFGRTALPLGLLTGTAPCAVRVRLPPIANGRAISVMRRTGLTPGVDDQMLAVAYSTNPATCQFYIYENPAVPLVLTRVIDEDSNRFGTWEYDSSSRGVSTQPGAGLITPITTAMAQLCREQPLGQQELYLSCHPSGRTEGEGD
jgi:hypothetical protein